MMKPEMINLFAVPVAKSPIGRNYTDSELKYIESQLERPSKAIDNYASPNKNVLAHDELKDLQTIIQQHLDNYFKAVYNTSNNVALQITQSWLTLSRKGESHHSHTHPNSVVSGVLYVNVAGNDGINFYRNEENLWFELEPSETNYYNSYKIHVATKVGDLVLFPSSVKHGVNKVTEDIKRVSLSFNTFFSGEMGNPEFSNALRITTS
ncbi:MAG: TIGR02466 family protein [Pseudomonadota bacterium]|nr:2OG-Fe(II) oxygenase family protein [Pseudomonadales bacterium]MEC9218199.1 TIGR02466 family protein [Pseudomonadota bacterium]MEC9299739.1 TIGR02466 family protein [Pseudomonadota bacterium]MED5529340.1 TIGR02466 family protein [Pseudomonadota bacterium]|tara:strand:- start:177 stop:800 length:624 start_codon:yes stop_codon:yes gene_type:complete